MAVCVCMPCELFLARSFFFCGDGFFFFFGGGCWLFVYVFVCLFLFCFVFFLGWGTRRTGFSLWSIQLHGVLSIYLILQAVSQNGNVAVMHEFSSGLSFVKGVGGYGLSVLSPKTKTRFLCVCVRACVRVCACVCVCACV